VKSEVGAVVIGRNEGARLLACLRSVLQSGVPAAYVDSGSTDGSVAAARDLGVETVELDLDTPFTAARARNAGFEALVRHAPGVRYVQFLDGDSELRPGWLERAAAELDARPDTAIVFGRCRERRPEASVYNRLCDVEWDVPVGESTYCGGNAMVRVAAFREAGLYDPTLIAGEEPEMCVRLRHRGWRIHRVDAEMNWHDADMTRFRQWWRRNVRNGHAFAQVSSMHRDVPERLWARESRSIWLWGLGVPAAAVLGTAALLPFGWIALLPPAGFAGLHAVQFARVFPRQRQRGLPPRVAAEYTASVILGKFAQATGQATFWLRKLRGGGARNTIIEYKGPAATAGGPGASTRGATGPRHGRDAA
jgi:GT2 family glycosyltransferase